MELERDVRKRVLKSNRDQKILFSYEKVVKEEVDHISFYRKWYPKLYCDSIKEQIQMIERFNEGEEKIAEEDIKQFFLELAKKELIKKVRVKK